jgi:hypothetical protein
LNQILAKQHSKLGILSTRKAVTSTVIFYDSIPTILSHHSNDSLDQYNQSPTPNLVRAYHNGGTFGLPEVKDVTREIAEWERNHANDLWRLVVLVKGIIRVVRENGGNAVPLW